jgi:excisionase family DNA binding protein
MGAAEAEDRLGVSRDTLIRMAAAGKIKKAVKLAGDNGQWVFDRDEVEQLAVAAGRAGMSA